MANIKEIKGNIFESTCQTIVNTVNCVGIMGRGIALEFKNRFPDMYLNYKKTCDEGKLEPGKLLLYRKTTPWILNFPTKIHWRRPSKIEFIEKGLKKFRDTYEKKNISSIAFPKLGVSSGGLDWDTQVKPLMYKYLSDLPNLDIEIYHFDPKANDSLFNKLLQKVSRFSLQDYIDIIGLKKKQATLLYDAINENKINSMLEIQSLEGFGEKSISKIYSFLNSNNQRIITQDEVQLSLPI